MKRRVLLAGAGLAAIAAGAGLYRFTDVIVKHYPPTPYDDLLEQLADRATARVIGARLPVEPAHAATRLREALTGQSLADAVQADVAAGRLSEVAGWLLPESVALLAALAARAG
ncbi:MAG: hypothetical protein BGN82_10460 [Alphaproteobacteria bacterium 65-7]|nr:MAG: hypothetical protein BGN82_10460 [Alphaproteobacteria bacterium 65-7]